MSRIFLGYYVKRRSLYLSIPEHWCAFASSKFKRLFIDRNAACFYAGLHEGSRIVRVFSRGVTKC